MHQIEDDVGDLVKLFEFEISFRWILSPYQVGYFTKISADIDFYALRNRAT